jgi:ATP synthase F1 delta subunit
MKNYSALYSTVLLELIPSKDQEHVLKQLKKMLPVLKNSLCQKVFLNPVISKEQKKQTLIAVSKSLNIEDLPMRFLNVLVLNKKLNFLPLILVLFEKRILESKGVVTGYLWSAYALSAEMIEKCNVLFSKKLDKIVQLENKVQSQLIGGIKVVVNGITYDHSIRTKLNHMQQKFKTIDL